MPVNRLLSDLNLAPGNVISAGIELQVRDGHAAGLRLQIAYFNGSEALLTPPNDVAEGNTVLDIDSVDDTGPYYRSVINGTIIPPLAVYINVGYIYDSINLTGAINSTDATLASRKPVINRGDKVAPFLRPSNEVTSGGGSTVTPHLSTHQALRELAVDVSTLAFVQGLPPYEYIDPSTDADNGWTVIVPTDPLATGTWQIKPPNRGEYDSSWDEAWVDDYVIDGGDTIGPIAHSANTGTNMSGVLQSQINYISDLLMHDPYWYEGTDISFEVTTNKIKSSGSNLGSLSVGETISVFGSANNEMTAEITVATAAEITIDPTYPGKALITEAAGETIRLTRQLADQTTGRRKYLKLTIPHNARIDETLIVKSGVQLNTTANLYSHLDTDVVITGSINPTASTAVVGVGTLFLSEVEVGDELLVSTESRIVESISDNTNLVVSTAFSNNGNDATPEISRTYAPIAHFKAGSHIDKLHVWSRGNGGVLLGTEKVLNDMSIGTIRMYNVGEVYVDELSHHYGVKVQGFNFEYEHIQADGGNIGVDYNGASDVRGGSALSVTASTACRITSGCDQIDVGLFVCDSPNFTGCQIDTSGNIEGVFRCFFNESSFAADQTFESGFAALIGIYSDDGSNPDPVANCNLKFQIDNTGLNPDAGSAGNGLANNPVEAENPNTNTEVLTELASIRSGTLTTEDSIGVLLSAVENSSIDIVMANGAIHTRTTQPTRYAIEAHDIGGDGFTAVRQAGMSIRITGTGDTGIWRGTKPANMGYLEESGGYTYSDGTYLTNHASFAGAIAIAGTLIHQGSSVGGGGSPLGTKGDLFTYDSADAALGVGADGQILSADNAETTGLKWVEAGGGVGSTAEYRMDAPGTDGAAAGVSLGWYRIAKSLSNFGEGSFEITFAHKKTTGVTPRLNHCWAGIPDSSTSFGIAAGFTDPAASSHISVWKVVTETLINGAHSVSATSFTVDSSTGFTIGETIVFRDGSKYAILTIDTVPNGTTITTTAGIWFALRDNADVYEKPASSISATTTTRFDGNKRLIQDFTTSITTDSKFLYTVYIDGATEYANFMGFTRTTPALTDTFTFWASSCAAWTPTNTPNEIADENPEFGLHMGDLGYLDNWHDPTDNGTGIHGLELMRFQYDQVLSTPANTALFGFCPTAYMYDDHDVGTNNGDKNSIPNDWAVQGIRENCAIVPETGTRATTTGTPYYSFVWGRCRFIITDVRTERDPYKDTDVVGKQVYSDAQDDWIIAEMNLAITNNQIIFWQHSYPFIDDSVSDEAWGRYTAYRDDLVDRFAGVHATKTNCTADVTGGLIAIGGDTHNLHYHNGVAYGDLSSKSFPSIHCGSIHSGAGTGGGIAGVWTAGGQLASGGSGQFGMIEVSDNVAGTSVDVKFTPFRDAVAATGTDTPWTGAFAPKTWTLNLL